MRTEKYIVAAEAVADNGVRQPILVKKHLSRQQINVLFILCEHVGRIIDPDDICFRMRISRNALDILKCRILKKLHYSWTIQTVYDQGMRIIYCGDKLADADKTFLRIAKKDRKGKRNAL